jgi:hypothetical protein
LLELRNEPQDSIIFIFYLLPTGARFVILIKVVMSGFQDEVRMALATGQVSVAEV